MLTFYLHPKSDGFSQSFKAFPDFSEEFFAGYSMTKDTFITLTPTQKDNVIQDLSRFVNDLTIRLKILVSLVD